MSKRDVLSPEKEPRKQSKKAKNNYRFFYRKRLLYVTHQKNPTHTTYIITSSRCFHQNSRIRNRKSLIVHHPKKTDRKNNPNPWIRNYPFNNCISVCRCLFLSKKKIPSCTLTKRNELTQHYQKCRGKSIIIHAVP